MPNTPKLHVAPPNHLKTRSNFGLDRLDIAAGEALAGLLRAGNAGSNTTADHITVLNLALAALPIGYRPGPDNPDGQKLLIRSDSAGATHGFAAACRKSAVGFSLGAVVNAAVRDAVEVLTAANSWYPAIDTAGGIRDGAWVAEATGLVDLSAWPEGTRLILRKERPVRREALLIRTEVRDTVIQLRAAIRKLLAVADRVNPELASVVRTALTRDDDYASLGKPPCDWDDPKAREALVDALVLVRDAQAALGACDGRELDGALGEATQLLALVAGQDVEAGDDGVFRIARRVARDRLISTVDTEARHGHKSRARTFDGYKSHLGIDPDDELITEVAVTAVNAADREVIDDLLGNPATDTASAAPDTATDADDSTETTAAATDADADAADDGKASTDTVDADIEGSGVATADADDAAADADADESTTDHAEHVNGNPESKGFEVYGDSAYADGATLDKQTQRGHDMRAKVPPVRNANGYSKDQFRIDLDAGTVTCPAEHTVPISTGRRQQVARFATFCGSCPLRAQCTKARRGRVITIHAHEAALQHAKARQRDPDWQAGRLSKVSAGRGTQDQSLHPPPLGWPQSPLPRSKTHPDRRSGPSRSDQPRPVGRLGPAFSRWGVGHRLIPGHRPPRRPVTPGAIGQPVPSQPPKSQYRQIPALPAGTTSAPS